MRYHERARSGLWVVALALAALVGCGGDPSSDGGNIRGELGGASGAAGAMGSAGSGMTAAGGNAGTGGALGGTGGAGVGGVTGAGGAMSGAGGAGGAPATTPTCQMVITQDTVCDKLNADGSISFRTKDGLNCNLCSPAPAQTPCLAGALGLCVRVCSECQ